MNPVKKLHDLGQSPWMDYIHRKSLEDGSLEKQIEEDGISGVTSNPSIFEQALGSGTTYDDALKAMVLDRPRAPAMELYEQIALEDIRHAADQLRPVYDRTEAVDGYVSLEVSPYRAYDTDGTVAQARRLFAAVDRPNVMIKVPATPEGVPAIEELLALGINVNVTLMFSLDHYEAVARAHLAGLRRLAERDPERLKTIASVASFFVSRVTAKVDPLLEAEGSTRAKGLLGKIAIANSKLAYERYREIYHGDDFAELRERGARPQRVLWASTSTKDPEYSDVLYVEELIGPETVNTLPPKTIDAYRDHGEPKPRLEEGWDEARERIETLDELGIDLDRVTEALQREGVEKFAQSFDSLLATVEDQRRRFLAESAEGDQAMSLGRALGDVSDRLLEWQDEGLAERIFAHDRTVWGRPEGDEILDRLGWLHLPRSMESQLDEILGLAEEVREAGFERVVVLGMGGSSLAPEVFARILGEAGGDHAPRPGSPALEVVDSTHPDGVAALTERIDPAKTLFVVSSKSGTTTETLSLFRHFWSVLSERVDEPGQHFVAVSDPGSKLHDLADERGFRAAFAAPSAVGGRYSALTHFGLVPAALAGFDVETLLDRGLAMEESAERRSEMDNEPMRLGCALGQLALTGRDKVTFWTSPALTAFPDWIEQLLAESTGKDGAGLVPVIESSPQNLDGYGDDRVFVYIALDGDPGDSDGDDGERHRRIGHALDVLEERGHPVIRLTLGDRLDLGREMYRWELATAAAGRVLDVQPFDQPDVQRAKDLAKKAVAGELDDTGDEPVAADGGRLEAALRSWLDGAPDDAYLGVQAYLRPPDSEGPNGRGQGLDGLLHELRRRLSEASGLAVTLGYGPRFLHSTGQLHKGGPASARFLQLLSTPRGDVPVPEGDASFGELIAGQALGDRQALADGGHETLVLDLGTEPEAGLDTLLEALGE